MILKIIGAAFVYLLCGVGVLELVRLHDRHSDFMHRWFDEDDDVYEIEQIVVVTLYPFFVLVPFIPWLIGKFIFAFIKAVQIIFTTLVYTVVALVKRENNE